MVGSGGVKSLDMMMLDMSKVCTMMFLLQEVDDPKAMLGQRMFCCKKLMINGRSDSEDINVCNELPE